MKKAPLFLLFIAIINFTQAQSVDITANIGGVSKTQTVKNGDNFEVDTSLTELKAFSLQDAALVTGHKLIIDVADTRVIPGTSNEYTDGTKVVEYKFQDDILTKQITITEDKGTDGKTTLLKFIFTKPPVALPLTPPVAPPALQPFTNIITRIEASYKSTPMGFIDPTASDDMIHIFLDEYGNNILGTIPQGISNKQYKIHIFYPGYSTKPDDIDYSVKQKTGTFSSALLFNNTGILNSISTNLQGNEQKNYDEWKEKTFILGTATDDVTFDVVATTVGSDNKPVNGILETYTIKMSPVYHGTFDVGLINSNLQNATHTLVQSPNNADEMVVKETDKSPKGIVTVMATIYTSPIILLEKVFEKRTKKHIPNYKLSGRNFLDDHKFYERIYPTVGVSISDKTFENLFFGLNWELARGLSLFGGGHWGKVSTFEFPKYIAGVTPVTQAQFDYYSNTKWKVDWAYGVKLDILIVTSLFK
jgi:hypothetical protein